MFRVISFTHRQALSTEDSDMSVDPKVGSMITEDLSTKCSIGSMMQSHGEVRKKTLDPIGSLGNSWDWILDPIGSLMELAVLDLLIRNLYDLTLYDLRKSWIQADPSHISGFNYAISG